MPDRLQRRRVKGWRKPSGAVIVDRTSRWGNPYRVGGLVLIDGWAPPRPYTGPRPEGAFGMFQIRRISCRAEAVALFREHALNPAGPRYPTPEEIRAELGGRDLVCACPLDGLPCHADVLLGVANAPVPAPNAAEYLQVGGGFVGDDGACG